MLPETGPDRDRDQGRVKERCNLQSDQSESTLVFYGSSTYQSAQHDPVIPA